MESLNCNSCGAPLQAPEDANYLTCNHCGQTLVVRRTDSATFTEAVERLTETTASLKDEIDDLARHNRLADLDRRWELERETYMITGRYGQRRLPTAGGALVGGVVVAVFGSFWIAMTLGITSSGPGGGPPGVVRVAFPLFGVVFVISGIVMSIRSFQKANDYSQASRRYQEERSRILGEES